MLPLYHISLAFQLVLVTAQVLKPVPPITTAPFPTVSRFSTAAPPDTSSFGGQPFSTLPAPSFTLSSSFFSTGTLASGNGTQISATSAPIATGTSVATPPIPPSSTNSTPASTAASSVASSVASSPTAKASSAVSRKDANTLVLMLGIFLGMGMLT